MIYNLFLDDERFPPSDGREWIIARSFQEAVDTVLAYGFPAYVSFDHDLGDGPNGMQFAKWLCERDLDHGDMPTDFKFAVHSMNPVGARNISEYVSNYLRQRRG